MPRKKRSTDEGTMLTHDALESVSGFEQTEAVAVLDANYSDTAQAAIAAVEADKKMWRTLANECADGATTPPDFLLKKLAPAVGLSELMAQTKFEEDVLALKNLKQAEAAQERYETKKAEFVAEHAEEKELQEQLADMLKQEKELRGLINQLQHFDRVIGSKKAITRRIGAAFTRLF